MMGGGGGGGSANVESDTTRRGKSLYVMWVAEFMPSSPCSFVPQQSMVPSDMLTHVPSQPHET